MESVLEILAWAWAACAAVCGRRAAGDCMDAGVGGRTLLVRGDAVLTLLLPLHRGPNCSELSLAEVQVAEATQLAVQKVNEKGFVPGASLGVRVVDTCGVPTFSAKMAAMAWVEDSLACPRPALTLGILGPGDAASASAVGITVRTLGVPVVGYAPRPISAPPSLDLFIPAPRRATQAAVQVLTGMGVNAVSVVYTDDEEGKTLAEHFVAAAEYWYVCVAVVVAGGEMGAAVEVLRGGPGTVVVVGSRHMMKGLAQDLGQTDDIIDLLVLLDGGYLPQVELAGLTTPAIILQQRPTVLPEFLTFLHRDLVPEDKLRRQYLSAVAECDSCSEEYFSYDAAVPTTVAAVLSYVAALRKAHVAICGASNGLCPDLYTLDLADWEDLLTSTSPDITTFPDLAKVALQPGGEDTPLYTVSLLENGNITQVGQADVSSAVLGKLMVPEPRCGSTCPCLNLDLSYALPEAANNTQPSTGFNIFGGAHWWSWELPMPQNSSKGEMAIYITAFSFVLVILLTSAMVCTYVIKAQPRN